MRLSHIAVERLEIATELAEIDGLELVNLQLERDEVLQPAVKEDQIERKVRVLAARMRERVIPAA